MARIVFVGTADSFYTRITETVRLQQQKGISGSAEMQLLRSIHQTLTILATNPFYGNSIQKHLIPKTYGVTNLWRIELAHFWRMLYTIKGDDMEVICFIVDIFNHKNYDKRFGYSSRHL